MSRQEGEKACSCPAGTLLLEGVGSSRWRKRHREVRNQMVLRLGADLAVLKIKAELQRGPSPRGSHTPSHAHLQHGQAIPPAPAHPAANRPGSRYPGPPPPRGTRGSPPLSTHGRVREGSPYGAPSQLSPNQQPPIACL